MKYYKIAVSAPIKYPLTYKSHLKIKAGSLVEVPLSHRKSRGLVLSESLKPDFSVKEILRVFDGIFLDSVRIKWIDWLSKYYFYPIGLVALSSFPSQIFKKKLKKTKIPIQKVKFSPLLSLNKEQKEIVSNIQKQEGFFVHLIHGVTGSGKTEMYFKLMEKVLAENKSVLFLVPEISLTPQLFQRISLRFPGQTSIIHSGVQGGKKHSEWMKLVSGEKKILLGARSSLFCPLSNLSLIIIDEEHETHFKQEEKLKYNARDAAVMLGKMYDIPVILGSATPSLETWMKASAGKYKYYKLEKRFQNRYMPEVHIVDLKKESSSAPLPFWLSKKLFQALKNTLTKKEQAALFLNRRGQSSISLCSHCGSSIKCPHCDVSLVLHFNKYLVCHYCGHSTAEESIKCCSSSIMHLGVGTEAVYSEIQKLFPLAKIQVADSDHIHTPHQFESLVKDMSQGKTDILIGTQMIAKGLDFPRLNLVGFLMADLALNSQDFRSSERCFQLIAQMGGRSGRHSLQAGQVLIQTYNPNHYAIQMGARLEFKKMAEKECHYRKKMNYPPFVRLVLIQISSPKKEYALKASERLQKEIISFQKKKIGKSFEGLGPAPAPIFKLRSKYRYQILLKSFSHQNLQEVCEYIWNLKGPFQKAQISLNRDPLFL